MKTDVSVPNKLLISSKADASDVLNPNIGTTSIEDARNVLQALITPFKSKVVKPVNLKHLFGMVNIVLNVRKLQFMTNRAQSATIVLMDSD
jgi:hypothetical protein